MCENKKCLTCDNLDNCEEYCIHTDKVNDAFKHMPELEKLESLAALFKTFGDLTRIRIICALFGRELCVCDIAKVLDMEQSAISHQLRILRSFSLVKVRKEGKSSFYSLDDEHIYKIFEMGLEHIEEKG